MWASCWPPGGRRRSHSGRRVPAGNGGCGPTPGNASPPPPAFAAGRHRTKGLGPGTGTMAKEIKALTNSLIFFVKMFLAICFYYHFLKILSICLQLVGQSRQLLLRVLGQCPG